MIGDRRRAADYYHGFGIRIIFDFGNFKDARISRLKCSDRRGRRASVARAAVLDLDNRLRRVYGNGEGKYECKNYRKGKNSLHFLTS